MFNHTKRLRIYLLVLFSLFMGGCNEFPKDLMQSNYQFEGRLIAGSFPGSIQILPNDRFLINITPENDRKSLMIQAIDVNHKVLFESTLKVKKFPGISLTLPYDEEPYFLKKSELNIFRPGMSHCFVGRKQFSVSLCLGARDFSLVISEQTGKTKLQLHGGLVPQAEPNLEVPSKLTLTMAMDRALNKNFQSQYDFETTIQAHNSSMASILNLLPHFRFTNGVGIYTMAQPVLLSSVGDWAPFLVPSRWFRALESRNQDYANRLGFQILQANLVQQVQMLALVFKHDQLKLEHIKNAISTVDDFLNRVKIKLGESEESPAILSIVAYRESLDLVESQMNAVISGDRAALSMALGYFNPKAVEDLEIDIQFLQIHELKVYDSNDLSLRAIDTSLELQQLQFVKDSLRAKKGSLALNWLDPAGSADTALGFNLIPQIKNIRSEISQIEHKANLIRQQIHQVSQLIERTTARAKVNSKEIDDTLRFENRRIQSLLARIDQESNTELKDASIFEISINETVKSLKTVLELQFEQEMTRLNWELGQVREERLLFIHRPRLIPEVEL